MRLLACFVALTLTPAGATATSGEHVVGAHGVRLSVPLGWSRVRAAADGPVTDPRKPERTITTAGVTVRVPIGWHAVASRTPACDPERLIVASSAPLRISASGRVASPTSRAVTVLLLEDRQVQDRPSGDLRLPRHFQLDWASLRTLAPDGFCGNPKGPAAMHYFKTHGRYLGYIVYPGSNAGLRVRAQTLALMDSLHVAR